MAVSKWPILAGAGVAVVTAAVAALTLPPSPTPTSRTGPGGNLLWPSEDFTKWHRHQMAAVELAAVVAPDGRKSANRLLETADDGRHFINNRYLGTMPGVVQTFSLFFKPLERTVRFELGDGSITGKYGTVMCDPSKAGPPGTGWIKGGDVINAAVEDAGQGWFRCWGAMPFGLDSVSLTIELLNQSGENAYKGDGQSGVLIWGAQLEPSRLPTAYVVTTTGPVVPGK